MKKIYTTIAIAIFFFTATTVSVNAQSFSWAGYSSGSTSNTTTYSGTTLTTTISGSGFVSGSPAYTSSNGGYIDLSVDWSNKTTTVTMGMSFSVPVTGVLFQLFDVDQNTGNWDDKVTVTGKDQNNNTIYPVITGTTYASVSGTNNNILEGFANNSTFSNSPAIVSFGTQRVKSITILYGVGASSPTNPSMQIIGVGTVAFASVLPVQLTSFTADKRSSDADLQWKAENMENFSRFEVERSATGAGSFEKIGEVAVNNGTQFSYTDRNVESKMKKAYYRLKMVDVDGTFKYSPVVMVSFGSTLAVDVRPTLLNAGELVKVTTSGNNAALYDVVMADMSGRIISSKKQVKGTISLETASLKKGVYVVAVNDGQETRSFRIVIQ